MKTLCQTIVSRSLQFTSATPFLNNFRIFYCMAKELAHILQKLEGPLEFGFLPLLGAFLGVKEVVCM